AARYGIAGGAVAGDVSTNRGHAHGPGGWPALVFFLVLRRPPSSPLFPYTTLFRSDPGDDGRQDRLRAPLHAGHQPLLAARREKRDRKSTRLNSSHDQNSYAVFFLKKKISGAGPRRQPRGVLRGPGRPLSAVLLDPA